MPRCLSILILSGLAGCAGSGGTNFTDAKDADGLPMAVKPEGVLIDRGTKMGPPPPGYYRIVGGVVPDWAPGAFDTRSNPMTWSFLGPKPISSEYWSGNADAGGRVISIAPHPVDANTCYIGSASGGVWKTTNGGGAWTPLTDELSTTNCGFVALAPTDPNTVYLGTGEWQQGSQGDGLFKSIDAGATWARIGTSSQVGNQVSGLAISSTDANVIHVSGSNGTKRTLNGGATWSQRMAGNASSIEIHPTNPSIVYVGRVNSGIYKSVNAGDTYTKLGGGLPTSGFSRIVMDISKSTPDVLYAAFIAGDGTLVGLYRTADGGTTWTKKTATPNFSYPQGWYDAYVGVSPTNENLVFCGGVDPRYQVAGVIRSTNGGDSWSEISDGPISGQLHPDHHVIAFGPTGTIWEGNDGGVWTSTNNGDSWVNRNNTLGAAQLYHVALHANDANKVLGGTQDNGTPTQTTGTTTWAQSQVGDGGFSAWDWTTPSRWYTTYVYLAITRWTSFGSSRGITGPWGSDPTNWISPMVLSPSVNTTLYAGTNRLWRTTNATATTPTWSAISGTDISGGGTLNAIAPAASDSNVVYTGSSNGRVYVTINGGTTWTNRSTGLPTSGVSDIIVNPTDANEAYVAHWRSSSGRIFRTLNGGASWTDVTGALASGITTQALEVDFASSVRRLFVGTGAGAYASLDGGSTWTKDGADLPNVNVNDLAIDRTNRTITAGTYGRGAWRSPLPSPFCPADFTQDGFVNGDDFDAYSAAFELGDISADFNTDGFVNGDDFDAYSAAFEAGC